MKKVFLGIMLLTGDVLYCCDDSDLLSSSRSSRLARWQDDMQRKAVVDVEDFVLHHLNDSQDLFGRKVDKNSRLKDKVELDPNNPSVRLIRMGYIDKNVSCGIGEKIIVAGSDGALFKATGLFCDTCSFSPGCKPENFTGTPVAALLAQLLEGFTNDLQVEIFAEDTDVKHIFTLSTDGGIRGRRTIIPSSGLQSDEEESD